jgi:acyl dehydratase
MVGRRRDRPGHHLKHCSAVAVATDKIGKTYSPLTYAVGREKIREYANATGETNPLHLDLDAARTAGFADLVAPPMFAVVYSSPAVTPAMFDPDLGIDVARVVHGAQELEWGPLVVAGDEVTTTTTVTDISERGGMGFYILEAVSENQRGETVCTGKWTIIVRGES